MSDPVNGRTWFVYLLDVILIISIYPNHVTFPNAHPLATLSDYALYTQTKTLGP